MFIILFFVSTFIAMNTALATPVPYDISPINRLNNIIQQQYINCATAEVVAQMGTKQDVAQTFEKEFIKEDDEQRGTNQACMRVVRKMIQKEDGSFEEINAVEFYHNVSEDFQIKKEELQREHDNYWRKKLAFQGLAGISAVAIAIGIANKKSSIGCYLLGSGVVSGAASGIGLYSIHGKQDLLKKHIAQVDTMKKTWDNQLSNK